MFFRGLEHEVCPSPWDRHPINSESGSKPDFFSSENEKTLNVSTAFL